VPADTLVTIPLAEPTVAIATLLLVHTPPATALFNKIVEPVHKLEGPAIAVGVVDTVTVLIATHPPEVVIVATPRDMPVTTPDVGFTVHIAGLLLLHVPVPVKVISEPTHTAEGPLIAGVGFKVVLPSIDLVHPVVVFVPTAVYMPAV
jgi:hypothetical protein